MPDFNSFGTGALWETFKYPKLLIMILPENVRGGMDEVQEQVLGD
ncbi:hypothetical protein [Palaeococcus sp. (in: euryarchaeotes)]|nr:hypothetical protein [Palaeococcus sp. (in: euryarchaeotes)]